MKQKFYSQPWIISILFILWPLIIPPIIGVVLIIYQTFEKRRLIKNLQETIDGNNELQLKADTLEKTMNELGITTYLEAKKKTDDMTSQLLSLKNTFDTESHHNNEILLRLQNEISELETRHEKLTSQVGTQERKLGRLKELHKSVSHSIDNFFKAEVDFSDCKLNSIDFEEYELIAPSVILKLHCMDIKELRKAYKEIEKQINSILEKYSARYTTKANRSIYQLMVIALRAELQNILYELKYEKLDTAVDKVKHMTSKYLVIVADGNQSISGTLTKFIGEIEYLFIDAVKIEYNYYVKKEQAKQEQLAIREQMRQEAAERKALEQERKKIEQEESKFTSEITKLTEQLETANAEELKLLNERILLLQSQLSDVIIKKDEITNLQNGKAGNIYIISNLGSFGENMFKVGMTRRLDPQERIDELGSASVPFKFDVHSFIFSKDAVELEGKLHKLLEKNRVNKVNPRKEFFYSTIDELETLVLSLDPTAEFNTTMLADDFRQSQSTDESYTSDYVGNEMDEDSEDD